MHSVNMIFHHPIIEDIEKDNPDGDAHHLIFGPLAESGHTAADFGNTHSSICVFLFQRYVFQSHHMPARMLMAMNPKKGTIFSCSCSFETEGG